MNLVEACELMKRYAKCPKCGCETVGNAFFFPALGDKHPVSHWCEIPEPPNVDGQGTGNKCVHFTRVRRKNR